MCGPSRLLIIKSNLKRGEKSSPKPKPTPKPQAVQDEHKVVFGIMQWECGGEESRLVILVTAAGGDPGVWGTPVWQCPADAALQLADMSWLMAGLSGVSGLATQLIHNPDEPSAVDWEATIADPALQ